MDALSELLRRVALVKENHELLKTHGGRSFNVFRLCGVDHYETAHSAVIAEFLNPLGSHGMKARLLELFLGLDRVKNHLSDHGLEITEDMLANARVVTEEVYENGRCDITIHFAGWCVVIENKVYASDQSKQLVRYQSDIERTERPILFYLTLDGHRASEDSSGDVSYQAISYHKEILVWLYLSAMEAYDRPYVRESINQYRDLVRELSDRQKEQKMKENIAREITVSPDAFDAARLISSSMQYARKAVAKLIMDSLRERMSKDSDFIGWELRDSGLYNFVDDNGRHHEYYHGFSIAKSDPEKRSYRVNCEFQVQGALSDLFIGISKWDCPRLLPQSFYQNVAEKLKGRYRIYPRDGAGWVYGASAKDSEMRNWTDEFLSKMIVEKQREVFVDKMAKYLASMIQEAERMLE